MLRLRSIAILAAIVCAAGSTAAIAAASTTHSAKENVNVTLKVQKTSIGSILVQNGGVIVYIFTKDKNGKNNCPASTGCATVWPPISGTPKLGPGVKKSLIGKIKDGKVEQVTYAGHPLYGYNLNSTSPSYVSTSQFGGVWQAINASGKIVKYS